MHTAWNLANTLDKKKTVTVQASFAEVDCNLLVTQE